MAFGSLATKRCLAVAASLLTVLLPRSSLDWLLPHEKLRLCGKFVQCTHARCSPVARHSSLSGDGLIGLEEAYAELGLPVGASIREVRRAFRRLARELHPDLCAPEDLAVTAMRFVAMKQAYDTIMSEDRRPAQPPGMSNLAGFMSRMATGQGHHTASSGQTHELWLDFRGSPEAVAEPQREVLQLFWKMRDIVDKLGLSLYAEGHVDGVVVEMDAASSCEGWDYTWLPLVLADESGALYNAQTKEKEGWLRNLADGQILSARSESNSEGDSADEDLFVFAADAEEASLARRRYGFAMSVLLMPLDPACWV